MPRYNRHSAVTAAVVLPLVQPVPLPLPLQSWAGISVCTRPEAQSHGALWYVQRQKVTKAETLGPVLGGSCILDNPQTVIVMDGSEWS